MASDSFQIISTEVRSTLRLAGPVILAQLAQMSMGLADTVMVGRLGKDALASVALGNTVFMFLLIMSMGVVMAVGPMVSQAYGAGEREPIGRSVRQGFWLGACLAVPATILVWKLGPILRAMGQPDLVVDGTVGYLHAVVWGFLPFLWFMALRSFVEGISRPLPVTVIALTGVVLNVTLNYILMYGKLGLPAFGIVGTGIATAITYWYLFTMLALFVRHEKHLAGFRIFERMGRPDPRYFRQLFQIGWPIGLTLGIESGLFTTTALLIGLLGATSLAAHQVALQCAAFAFMVPLGVGIATSVRVGQAAGRGDRISVRRAGFTGVILAAAFMSCTAVAFWAAPHAIIGAFLDLGDAQNAEVVELAVTLLGVAAVFQIFDGVQVSAAGALRGLKDTRRPMLIGFFSYWMIGLSSGVVFGFVMERGALGMWWGLVLGLAAAAVLLTLRFKKMTAEDLLTEVDSTESEAIF